MSALRVFFAATFFALYACAIGAAVCGVIWLGIWSVATFGPLGLPIACVCVGLLAVVVSLVANGP